MKDWRVWGCAVLFIGASWAWTRWRLPILGDVLFPAAVATFVADRWSQAGQRAAFATISAAFVGSMVVWQNWDYMGGVIVWTAGLVMWRACR